MSEKLPLRVRLNNPGGLLWWPGYLAWRLFGICWVGHRLGRATDDCDMFWDAESTLIHWGVSEVGLTEPPLVCVAPLTTTTSSSATVQCNCGRHV